MLQANIRIDGRDHFLPHGDDVEAIMTRITEQLRAGGGFVEIVRTPHRSVSVLISPGVSLIVEVADVDDEPEESDAELETVWRPQAWFSSIDLM